MADICSIRGPHKPLELSPIQHLAGSYPSCICICSPFTRLWGGCNLQLPPYPDAAPIKAVHPWEDVRRIAKAPHPWGSVPEVSQRENSARPEPPPTFLLPPAHLQDNERVLARNSRGVEGAGLWEERDVFPLMQNPCSGLLPSSCCTYALLCPLSGVARRAGCGLPRRRASWGARCVGPPCALGMPCVARCQRHLSPFPLAGVEPAGSQSCLSQT